MKPIVAISWLLGALTTSQATSVPFFDPRAHGGSLLDNAAPGLGEPMNVIVSGQSDPRVLTDSGFLNWARSLHFTTDCFLFTLIPGFNPGAPQSADLGDGNGAVNQTFELRNDFGDVNWGTCLETLVGSNHLRMFRQNGTLANSGALFLAVSQEESIFQAHTISANGYDVGRDLLVEAATKGRSSFNNVTYTATKQNITGLLEKGSEGVNHGIALDGIVVLLTVRVE